MDADQEAVSPNPAASDVNIASSEHGQDLPESHGDPTLVRILEWSNLAGIGFDITLFINGMLVTGKPISHAQYYQRLAGQIEDIGKNANPVIKNSTTSREEAIATMQGLLGQLADWFEGAGERAQESILKKYGIGGHEQDPMQPWPAHVHLETVTIFRGGSAEEEFDLPLWRGELDAVTAWYIGRQGLTDYEG